MHINLHIFEFYARLFLNAMPKANKLAISDPIFPYCGAANAIIMRIVIWRMIDLYNFLIIICFFAICWKSTSIYWQLDVCRFISDSPHWFDFNSIFLRYKILQVVDFLWTSTKTIKTVSLFANNFYGFFSMNKINGHFMSYHRNFDKQKTRKVH